MRWRTRLTPRSARSWLLLYAVGFGLLLLTGQAVPRDAAAGVPMAVGSCIAFLYGGLYVDTGRRADLRSRRPEVGALQGLLVLGPLAWWIAFACATAPTLVASAVSGAAAIGRLERLRRRTGPPAPADRAPTLRRRQRGPRRKLRPS